MKNLNISAWCKLFIRVITIAALLPSTTYATGPRVTTSLFTPNQNEIHALDFPPFISNEVIDGGAASEIIATTLRTAGIDATITVQPIKKIVHYYLEQENALAIVGRHMHIPSIQQDKLIFIPVLATKEQYIYYKPSHPQGLNLQTKKQKLTYGAHQGEDTSQFKKAGMNIVFGRTSTLLKKLKSGEVDFIESPTETIQWLINRYFKDDQKNFVQLEGHSDSEVLYIIFNRQHQDGESIAKKFKQALSTMRKDGTYQNIITKHLGNGDTGKLYLRRLNAF